MSHITHMNESCDIYERVMNLSETCDMTATWRVTWLIDTSDKSCTPYDVLCTNEFRYYVQTSFVLCVWLFWFIYGAWLLNMLEMTYSCWKWLIHVWDMTHSCVGHYSLSRRCTLLLCCICLRFVVCSWRSISICGTWLINMLDMRDVLQCVAVCCSVLQSHCRCHGSRQCVAVCCSVLQCVAVCCSVLQCVLDMRDVTHWVASALEWIHAPHCNTLQHTATHCNTLQHMAAQYRVGRRETPSNKLNTLCCSILVSLRMHVYIALLQCVAVCS